MTSFLILPMPDSSTFKLTPGPRNKCFISDNPIKYAIAPLYQPAGYYNFWTLKWNYQVTVTCRWSASWNTHVWSYWHARDHNYPMLERYFNIIIIVESWDEWKGAGVVKLLFSAGEALSLTKEILLFIHYQPQTHACGWQIHPLPVHWAVLIYLIIWGLYLSSHHHFVGFLCDYYGISPRNCRSIGRRKVQEYFMMCLPPHLMTWLPDLFLIVIIGFQNLDFSLWCRWSNLLGSNSKW